MLALVWYDWFKAAKARIRRILLVSRVDALILLFIVFDMTAKPWS